MVLLLGGFRISQALYAAAALGVAVPPGDTPHLSKISGLNMLAMMGGQERTETEWRELLTTESFADVAVHQTSTPFHPGDSAITGEESKVPVRHTIEAERARGDDQPAGWPKVR